jgi:hypothetical protein
MNDDDNQVQDGGAGAADPFTPALPVTPTAEDGKLTEAEQNDLNEWGAAADNIFPGLSKSQEDNKDGKTEPEKGTQEAPKDGEADPNKEPNAGQEDGTKPQPPKPDAAKPTDDKPGADKTDQEDEPPEPTDAASRISAREREAAVAENRAKIEVALFGEKGIPTQLVDADGDPIKTVEDVMRHNNPRTGQPFENEEQAAQWLLAAQNQVKANAETSTAELNSVMETQQSLADQTDIIAYQYGELLNAMPELKEQLWAEYSKGLTYKNGVIVKAPQSLEKFYETALEPYAQMGRTLEAQETSGADAAKAAADKAAADKAATDKARQQNRSDRSDIYGGGKDDTRDDDTKEWDAAAVAVFGDQLKGLTRR